METNYEAIGKAHSAVARERVLTDLQTLTRDTEDLLKATAGDVGEKAKEARKRLATTLDAAKATCRELQEEAADTAKSADELVRRNPYQSIGLALVVGLVIGLVLKQR